LLTAHSGGSGSAKQQSGFRPLCGFASPHFAVASLASQALLRSRKTSVTCYVMRHCNNSGELWRKWIL